MSFLVTQDNRHPEACFVYKFQIPQDLPPGTIIRFLISILLAYGDLSVITDKDRNR